jgi:2'-5' RNA ligase
LVRPNDWHVTLSFLGSLPDHEIDALVQGLRSATESVDQVEATLGPGTLKLGRGVLCVPVSGLEELAAVVHGATAWANRSDDPEERFVGHLTLARTRRRAPIPRQLVGLAVSTAWVVDEIRLVSSTTRHDGPHYEPVAHFTLRPTAK